MSKWISISVAAGAIAIAAICAVVFMNKKEAVARAELAKAESRETAAKEAARKAASDDAAARARESAAQAEAQAAEQNRIAKEAEREAALAAAEKAKLDREAAADNRAAREAAAAAASDQKAAEKARAEAARAEADKAAKEAEKAADEAQAAADALAREKLRSEAVIAEEKLWELKQLELVELERDLVAYKRELDEREAALRPEKTIKDLVNIGAQEETKTSDDPVASLPENDMSLPEGERRLAKAERILAEGRAERAAKSREFVVELLERMFVDAIRDGRVIDAEFYKKTIKELYPDWEYRPQNTEQEEVKQ